MAETIHILGEGGGIHAMDLPLPEGIAERLAKGHLRRVNEDGSPYEEGGPETVAPPVEQPPQSAAKALWVGWAIANGADADEAEAMTKQDLIDAYGGES
ncbi:hypothetical protein [Streptomyces sp. R33]|uniref:Uncharacterized protein n=1 Tax=Streptomyces sp. R33 TaxID=3238629 RepID=A0AB39Y8Y8_9ACTN